MNTINKFEETASVSEIIILQLLLSVEKPRICQFLDVLNDVQLRRILHLDLYLHPHKVELTQELRSHGAAHGRTYANKVIEQQTIDADFSNRSFFNFPFNALWLWGSQNPQVIVERPLYP